MATKDQSGLVLQQSPWGSGTLLPGLCGTSRFCLFRFISSSWRNWPAGSFLGCGVWEVKQFWELPWLKTSLCYPPTWSMLWLLLVENHFCSEAWRRGSTFHFLFPCDCSRCGAGRIWSGLACCFTRRGSGLSAFPSLAGTFPRQTPVAPHREVPSSAFSLFFLFWVGILFRGLGLLGWFPHSLRVSHFLSLQDSQVFWEVSLTWCFNLCFVLFCLFC